MAQHKDIQVHEEAAVVVQQCLTRAEGRAAWGCAGPLLSAQDPLLRAAVVQALRPAMLDLVRRAWLRGWQPRDLHHYARRRVGVRVGRLVDGLVSAELSRYAASTVHPAWWDQVASTSTGGAGGTRPATEAADALSVHHDRCRGWPSFATDAADVVVLLTRLPAVEHLGPLPGEADAQARSGDAADDELPDVDPAILTRVRRLLAKAESTTFEAEAETFTAGAQALMARHRLDRAVLDRMDRMDHARETAPQRTAMAVRLPVERPYEAPKALLLHVVAEANGCRSVWSSGLGLATVVGQPADLHIVELLHTSLLVQATAALRRHVADGDGPRGSAARSHRASFFTGFATRTGERLTSVVGEQARAASVDCGRADTLVRVMADRDADVAAAVRRLFPRTSTASVAGARDAAGWLLGRAAADLAHWDVAPTLTDRGA